MPELNAIGPEPHQRWQKDLPENEGVCLGRAPRQGWRVPWDIMISREHAQLEWRDGKLFVKCLETARNPIVFRDIPNREFQCLPGDTFRIGSTRFVVSVTVASPSTIALEERTFDREEVRNASFGDPTRQMELISRVPELIRSSRTDEDLAVELVSLLLEALPRTDVAAVVQFNDPSQISSGKPTMMRWDGRNSTMERFVPSLRLMEKAALTGNSVVHQWNQAAPDDSVNANYTVYGNLDWAICTPLTHESCRGWYLYVSGKTSIGSPVDKLKSDLRFIELMAEFIGSVRQIRQLERLQAGMSQFFSPTVLETLNAEKANILLQPREGDITVIFCDVRGFSKMVEGRPQNMLQMLERVSQALEVMTRGIVKQDGIIADFQGDAALGFWGWPVAIVDGPIPACLAALEIQADFRRASAEPGHPLADFRIGVGIAHGRAVAGRIGSELQAKVGVFGHVVNLGSRLEGLTRLLGVSILIDDATAAHVRDAGPNLAARVRRLGWMRPYGFDKELVIHELLPPAGDSNSVPDSEILVFESAVDLLHAGDWGRAASRLESLPENDGVRNFLLRWIHKNGGTPPAVWDGVIGLEAKS